MSKPFWCVARTKVNQEQVAIKNLKNQGFSYYQPLLYERRRNQNKQGWRFVEIPLFPCYLFVQVTDKWLCLDNTHGITSIIKMGAAPAIVQDKVIADLKQREDQSGYIQLPKSKLMVNDQVKIKTGAFAEQLALVERMPSKQRQKILLALLSNKIKVLVDENDLELSRSP